MEEMAETVGGLLEDSDTITTEVEEEIIALPGEVEELVVVVVEEKVEVEAEVAEAEAVAVVEGVDSESIQILFQKIQRTKFRFKTTG